MYETGALVECVEGKFFDERYAVNLDVVAFGPKLHLLYFLASYDWTHVWLVDAHDTIWDAFFGIATLVMVALLTVYPRYRLYFRELTLREQPCARILPVESSQFCEYLPQQLQQSVNHPACPFLSVTALLHIGHVVTGHIKVFRPHAMNSEFPACHAHHRIHLFYTLPQQFGVGWVTHGTLVTGGVGIEGVEILHVRLPCFSQCLLLILYLQAAGQLQGDVIYELVVGQWIPWTDPDAAE